jgi:phage terminase small subunit
MDKPKACRCQSGAKPRLNHRQTMFVLEYLKDGNGTQAAIRAGYGKPGADVQAARLLGNVRIWTEIQDRRRKFYERHELTAERVHLEWATIAFLDPAAFFDENDNLLPITRMPPEARRALARIEIKEIFELREGRKTPSGVLRKIIFSNKLVALQALAKDLGMLNETAEVKARVSDDEGLELTLEMVRRQIIDAGKMRNGIDGELEH